LNLPILEVRDVKKVALVLVTGDRGLCGGYNSAVIKSAARRIEKLRSQGIEVSTYHSYKIPFFKNDLVGGVGTSW
jgi:F0F1-type ATP synthase gamma subunit